MTALSTLPLYHCVGCGLRVFRRLEAGWYCARCPLPARLAEEWEELAGEPEPQGVRPIERRVSEVRPDLGDGPTIGDCRRLYFAGLRRVPVAVAG